MTENKNIMEKEIGLIEIMKNIWVNRKWFIIITLGFMVFGIVIAFTSRVEYQASCKLFPENQGRSTSKLGGLSNLANLAGINLNSKIGENNLSLNLYPEIINSFPNQLKIIHDTLDFESKGLRISSFDYFKNYKSPTLLNYIIKYTIGLPSTIIGTIIGTINSWVVTKKKAKKQKSIFNNYKFYRLTKTEWGILQNFKNRINIETESESGLIKVTVKMPDAVAAAQLTDKVVNIMTEKIIEYRIKKMKNNLNFVQNTHKDAEKRFEKAQLNLAIALDRNKNLTLESASIQLETLKNQYNLAFELFRGLAVQMEQTKIKLKEETPVFTVLEPIRIPEKEYSPKKGIILMVSTFLGMIVSCVFIVIKLFIKSTT